MRVVGLFSGIGGFEVGLARAGHQTELLCEIDPGAVAVLTQRLPRVPRLVEDITLLRRIPSDAELVVAGFPCINLSLAGIKEGIQGQHSSLVNHVFRLLQKNRVPTVILENVPFMLHLNGGAGILALAAEFERLGYQWAYRVVDALGFGLPQRRERVFLVASRLLDPRSVLFADNCGAPAPTPRGPRKATGFYWTEGVRGIGWADEALPTLKGGSTVGIPSPPAIWVENQGMVLPDIRDAERLQGFDAGWTTPAEAVTRPGHRWKLIGNAVSTRVVEWLGRRLADPGEYDPRLDMALNTRRTLPNAAWSDGKRRYAAARITKWASATRRPALMDWLEFEPRPLSKKAANGLLQRTAQSRLHFRPGFLKDRASHAASQAGAASAAPN